MRRALVRARSSKVNRRIKGVHGKGEEAIVASQEKHDEDEGAPWIRALEAGDYEALTLDLRISMLASLCDLAMAGPTVRWARNLAFGKEFGGSLQAIW